MAAHDTQSLCPVCLKRIAAKRAARDDKVFLVKSCPEHGEFREVIWQGQPPMDQWQRPKTPLLLQDVFRERQRGCPFDCGLCPEHRQRSCTVLLEVTHRCNLNCSVCFADSGSGKDTDPSLAQIRKWYRAAHRVAAGSNIQLSGGEPTLRDDLPDVVAEGRAAGFGFIQLNTNGIRLARDGTYLRAIKEAGIASVFLQFDGTDDEVYLALRGAPLLETKRLAIEACGAYGIGVVLVPTLVPGVNTDRIGDLLRFAVELSPIVRGIHFQPISYFGRFPGAANKAGRITLPELMQAIEYQSDGLFKATDFRPPGCENAWCSFNADYFTLPDGGVRRLQRSQGLTACCSPIAAEEGARRAMAHVARKWAGSCANSTCTGGRGPFPSAGEPLPLDDFLDRARCHTLTVSAMAFQDVWTLDLERLRDCCIHVLDPDHGLVPFCAYNITSADGKALYRR